MATHRRPNSPTGPRIYLDAPRASTGTMLASTYDTRYDQRPSRASFSVSTLPPSQPSGSRNNSVYETQPVSKKTYIDAANPGGTISRTEYAVRPRKESGAAETRRPLSVSTKNISPTGDYVESPREMVIYKQPREDPSRLLSPGLPRGSAHHQRHNSATRAETGRYFSAGPSSPRVDREYHKRGPYVEKVAQTRPVVPLARYEEPAYEYTGPREQFDRDYPAPAALPNRPGRESVTRRERPSSAMGTKFEPPPFRREAAPPPSSTRQLQRVDRDDQRSGFESDPDRVKEPRRSRASHKGPVVHQREDGYSSAREEYEPRRALPPRPYDDDVAIAGSKSRYRDVHPDADRERERVRREYDRELERPSERDRDRDRHERRHGRNREREYERERDKPRPREYEVVEEEDDSHRRHRRRDKYDDRDDSPERSSFKTVATAAVGGLAAAGIVGAKSRKDGEVSDSESRRERNRERRRSPERPRDERRGDDTAEERKWRRSRRREHRHDSSGSDTPDDDPSRRRPQSRTRRRRDTHDGHDSKSDKPGLATLIPGPGDRRPSREVSGPEGRSDPSRDPVSERAKQESPVNNEGRTLSPGDGEDGRPRKVSIVEPGKESRPEFKPKGILKPPREVPFPEDPNPTREGVAPLKQAGKDGIPTGARWTKVNRILVNPEALERAQERFEERDDYVIVLRVLSREEIDKLAEKTREIRAARERERQIEVEERRKRRRERGERDTEDENDYDDPEPSQPTQLAIEPPSSAPPVDLRQFAHQNTAQPPQLAYAPQQSFPPPPPPPQAYPPQQTHPQEWQHPQQPQQQPPLQPQWQSQQWTGPPQHPTQPQPVGGVAPSSARSSAERIANTAPGQPVPGSGQGQPQPQPQPQEHAQDLEASTYSQNV